MPKSLSHRLVVKLLTSTAKDLAGEDQDTKIKAMRWSLSATCREACDEIGIPHHDYLQALQYINRSGPVRGPVIAKDLSRRLRG